jgi:hypothetical protein
MKVTLSAKLALLTLFLYLPSSDLFADTCFNGGICCTNWQVKTQKCLGRFYMQPRAQGPKVTLDNPSSTLPFVKPDPSVRGGTYQRTYPR